METFSTNREAKNLKTPQEELAYLRARLAEKESEIAKMNAGIESAGGENTKENISSHAVSETVRNYSDTSAQNILHKDYALTPDKAEAIVLELTPEEHDDKMAELLSMIQEHGIKNTITVVQKMNDPHIQDDFERFLVQYIKSGFSTIGLNEKSPEFKALNMTLFEVTLPEKKDTDKQIILKEVLGAMEQFYSGMLSVGDDDMGTGYFTIELAVANNSDDFTFFVAVHNTKRSIFEKQILAVFHNAKIVEKKDDYNIFNEEGVTVASYAKYDKDSIWPLKTYEQFEYDPLNSILNSFSKIKTHGQGAAIQILFRPKGDKYNKRYKKILDDVLKGEKISESIKKHSDGVMKYVDKFFKGISTLSETKEQKEKREMKKRENASSVDQLAVESFKQKLLSPTVSANIRIVSSAENETMAKQILGDIESAFNQFENTNGNKLVFEEAEKSTLKTLLYDFSYRLYDEDRSVHINLKELTGVMHFPSTVIKSAPHLKTAKAGTAPAPLELSKTGILLGINRDRGNETKVFMAPEDRLRHFYVIGQTGTGKTTLLKNMITQDILNGEGVCMIDPHGSDIQDILAVIPKSRYEDVIYFDPSHTARPMALNMLEYDSRYPEQKTFVVNEMLSIFNKLFDMKVAGGPMFEQYFRNSVLLVMEDPSSGNTLLDVSRVLSNKAFRDMKLSNCKNPIVVQFWKEVAEKAGGEASLANIVPYITSKFDVFLSNDIMRPIIAQESSTLNFREIMDSKKILLVNLSKGRLGDINANLIGLILVGKILMAALSRVDSVGKDMPPFYLYIDEFQNITTDSISTILSEARKYKLALNIAHQFIAQLEEGIRDSVFGNVGSIASFRVGAEDAEYLEKQFAPVFSTQDIMSIDNFNGYLKILANGRPVKPFNIETLPPPNGNRSIIESIKELSYLKYGRDKTVVEQEIMLKYRK